MIDEYRVYKCPRINCKGNINIYDCFNIDRNTKSTMEQCECCGFTRITEIDRHETIVKQYEYIKED